MIFQKKNSNPFSFYLLILLLTFLTQELIAQQSQVEQIHSLLEKYHEYKLFNGSVLVAKDGSVIYKNGFGDANMSWDIPNTPDTKFRIGSTTKQFTAALVLILVEDGLLELDGKITDYLPDYPEQQGNQVTIHHLLSHTSGIPSYTTPDFMTDEVRDPFQADSLVALFSDLELQFAPGSRWTYSNSNYILLGKIIEAVTGKPYDEILRERVLKPCGLDNTGYDHYSNIIKKKAEGYIKTPEGYEHARYLDTSVPYSAGMLYSTVEDLYRWNQLLHDKGPFKQVETKSLFFDQQVSIPKRMNEQLGLPPAYGYGWFTGNVPIAGDSVFVTEHGGSIFGFSSGFWRMPEDEHTIIILDNTSSNKVREIGRSIQSILYRGSVIMPKQSISDVLYEVIAAEGVDSAKTFYREAFENNSGIFDFNETELNVLGYYYLNNDHKHTAIEIFKLNAESYPKSVNVYDSLGEAYMRAGNKDRAIKNFKKVLELNPNHSNAAKMLRNLCVGVE